MLISVQYHAIFHPVSSKSLFSRVAKLNKSSVKYNAIFSLKLVLCYYRVSSVSVPVMPVLFVFRGMLQASDAQNIAMQVALKRYQRNLVSGSTENLYFPRTNNRHSMPVDHHQLVYQPLKGTYMYEPVYLFCMLAGLNNAVQTFFCFS